MAAGTRDAGADLILGPAQRAWLKQAGSTVLHLAAFYIVIIAVAVPAVALLSPSVSGRPHPLEILAQSIPIVLAAGGITVFLVRRGGWTLRTIGWPRATAGLRSLGVGLTIGVTMAASVVVTLLGGDAGVAVQLGSVPFLLGDALKIVFAGLVIWRLAPVTRARI